MKRKGRGKEEAKSTVEKERNNINDRKVLEEKKVELEKRRGKLEGIKRKGDGKEGSAQFLTISVEGNMAGWGR